MTHPERQVGPYAEINSERVGWFVDLLVSPDRERPAVVISTAMPADRPRVDPGLVGYEVDAVADVYVFADTRTARVFSELAPQEYWAYGGGVRVIFPVYEGRDAPLFTDHGDPVKTAHAIARTVGLRPRSPRPEQVRPLVVVPDPGTARENRITELEKQVRNLQRDLKTANGKIHSLTAAAATEHQPVFGDPGEQFRHELWLTWLRSVSEPERDRFSLRDFTFGPDWFDSIGIADRDKVLTVAVDVLTRRVHEMAARQAHQQRISEVGGAPTMTRYDGALAWRCYLQNNTAAAQRLMWWELPDGTVEFGRVALHDDMKLR